MFEFFKRKKPESAPRRPWPKNPHLSGTRDFFSGDVDRLLSGWTNNSSSIDAYLRAQLPNLKARSREAVRKNPYGKRFVTAIKSNIVGPVGVSIQAETTWLKQGKAELDAIANDAIEVEFKKWCKRGHCDLAGLKSFKTFEDLAISNAGVDGEFVFRLHFTGKYGLQLSIIDSELLDATRNEETETGEIRLGVEYNVNGKPLRYHFRKRDSMGNYLRGDNFSVPANQIIHGYIHEWPDQSRGVPWTHAVLERTKHLDKYQEAAIVASRYGAAKALFLSSADNDAYQGDEDDDSDALTGKTIDSVEAGSIQDIGNRKLEQFDPTYPHAMYGDFTKECLRSISAGIGVSYHSISNDLEGVNYSSIRSGVLEDREIFKGLQGWFIEAFVQPVYEAWIANAYLRGVIKLGARPLSRELTAYLPARYQGRRWEWVDPAKDGAANQLAINNRTKSISQIIRDAGGDPTATWREIASERDAMRELGILTEENPEKETETETDDNEEDDDNAGKSKKD